MKQAMPAVGEGVEGQYEMNAQSGAVQEAFELAGGGIPASMPKPQKCMDLLHRRSRSRWACTLLCSSLCNSPR